MSKNYKKSVNCLAAGMKLIPAVLLSAAFFLLSGVFASLSFATERTYVSPAPAQPAPQQRQPKYVQPRQIPQQQYQYKYRYQYSAPKNWYGQRRSVPNAYEAGRIMGQYYRGRDVRIGPVLEKDLFYQADVRDRNGVLVDKVIIDKRTGRMRSIY